MFLAYLATVMGLFPDRRGCATTIVHVQSSFTPFTSWSVVQTCRSTLPWCRSGRTESVPLNFKRQPSRVSPTYVIPERILNTSMVSALEGPQHSRVWETGHPSEFRAHYPYHRSPFCTLPIPSHSILPSLAIALRPVFASLRLHRRVVA